MYTIEEVIKRHKETIAGLGYGRTQLQEWLNENLEGEYTQYFARRLLEQINSSYEPLESDYKTMEELLREIYGLQDPTWVPVSVWGDPRNPRAKWERRLSVIDKEKIDELQRQIRELNIGDSKIYEDGRKLAVLSIRDAHFGMFTDHPEPYNTYNLAEAQEAYLAAAADLILKAKRNEVTHLVYIVGSDMINVDGPANTTTRGTPQDVSTNWTNAFKAALESANAVIQAATEHFDGVTVVCEPGNHDNTLAKALGISLQAKWGDKATVLAEGDDLKRVKFGKTDLFFHHGDKIKPEDYQGVIYARYPDCATPGRYVEVLTGHLHHRRRTALKTGGDYLEEMGIVFRITPALCPSSNWSESMGYDSEPGAQLTIYNTHGFESLFEFRVTKGD